MSPAMVDFQSPASASSKLHTDHPGPGSSIKGRIPSSSSHPLFNPSGIPEPSPTVDRGNFGHGVPASSSASPPPLFPSFSTLEKPTPAQKLSAQRFLKQRKHSTASRARPAATTQDGGAVPGFHPFRSVFPGGDHIDEADDRRTQSVQEQLYGWKPFVPDASSWSSSGAGFLFGDAVSRSNESSCNTGGSIQGTSFGVANNGRGNTGTGFFVFRSGMGKVSSLSRSSSQNSSAQSLGSIESTKSEGAELIFGAGSFSDSNVKVVETGIPVGSVCSVSADNVFSDTGAFVFRSSAKKDCNLRHHSSLSSDNSFGNLKSQKPVNEKSGKLDSSFLGFESDEKKGTHSSKKSSFGSDEGLFTEKSDITKKMDQPNSSKDCQKAGTGVSVFGSFEKPQGNAYQSPSLYSNESLFSSFSNLPEDLRKLNIENSSKGEYGNKDQGVFVFGSGVKNSTYASKISSFGSFDSSFSKLPEKMEKLNLKNSADEVHVDTDSGFFVSRSSLNKGAQFTRTSSLGLGEGAFSKLHGELRKLNLQSLAKEENGNNCHRDFIFGSDVNNTTKLCKSSSPSFDEGSNYKLPNEIGKMKLSSSGSEDDTQNRKQGDTQNKHNSNVAFMFAANKDTSTSKETGFPSQVPNFQPFGTGLNLNSMHIRLETPKMEFRNKKQDTSCLTKDNLFAEPHKNMAFGMIKGESKGVRLKTKRGKSRQSVPIHSGIDKQFASLGKGSEGNLEQDATREYSPMDYSPYQETSGSNQCSREVSVAYDESLHFDSMYTSTHTRRSAPTDGKEEELVSTTEYFSANEGTLENEEAGCYGSSSHSARQCTLGSSLEIPEHGKGDCVAKDKNVGHGIQTRASSVELESFSFGSRIRQPIGESESGFTFTSNSQDVGQSNFLFGAKSSVQDPLSASKSRYRRKIRVKSGQDSHNITKVPMPSPVSNLFLFPNAHDQKQKCIDNGERGKVNEAVANPESTATSAASVTAHEACEKWRLRGNQAYADGNLFKAEDYYSHGVNSVSLKEISKSCSRALMLCYSNRAATRKSLGRLRGALNDCYAAVAIDPSFLRARVRAGNIHLSLGETEDALQHFQKCLQLEDEAKSDQKILLEAVDGLEKARKLKDLMDQSSVYLTKRTSSDATKALEIISEALSIGSFSESLLEMKAEALVMLRNYEEAIHACEQTLELSEKNAVVTDSDCQLMDNDCPESMERSYVSLWRWRIISKSYFYLGKLEEANELLQKHEKMKPVIEKYGSRVPESSTSFAVTVRELLRLKTAGNEAFQAGRHLEAVELYTAALVLNTESRPFTAICFCNRAAAFQALGQITDAIADCSLAIALDSSYRKAVSRRATLHEMIRDYGQAVTDLCRLISLLEKSSEDKYNTSGALGRSSSNVSDLNQARKRLFIVEEEARKGATLDMYMILRIERSSSTSDVKKAYRQAALRHHPDKAGQFLARSENGDDRIWKEVADEVYSDADRLFKMIGEAYTILVDPSKRLQYDAEEELRTMKKGYGGNSSPRTPASSYSGQYERSADRRTNGSTHRRWSESTRSNR